MRCLRWLGTSASLVVAVFAAAVLFAAPEGLIEVTVRCELLKGRHGVPLRVLQATPLGVAAVKQDSPARFDSAGECKIALTPGEYVFEVDWVEGQTFIALRTPVRRLARGAVVELEAAEPVPVTFKLSGNPQPRLEEFAVRSAATMGETKWSGDSQAPLVLILSPGQQYRVRALGGEGDLRFAIWQEISTTRPVLLLEGDRVCRCKFKIRTDGPAIERATVRFQFPDSALRFPVTDKTVLLTNRRFMSFGYGIELANGRRVQLRPWLGLVKREQEFILGGPFTAGAWANIMMRKPVGGPETRHLVWGANLYDAAGHMAVLEDSQIDWQSSVRTLSGTEVYPNRPLTKEQIASFRTLQEALLIDVSYCLDKPVSATLQPQRFAKVGSKRFHTAAPPHWEIQALNYLSRAARVYHIIEDLEGKPSRHRVEVRWHAMNGTAWGCAPSGNKAHIMMPFSGLRKSFNFYETPWALAHEMLHTFGYGHGERMGRMTGLVERRFDQYRWFMADHPEHDPETAFDAFRVATQTGRPLAPPGNVGAKAKAAAKKVRKKAGR